MPMSPKEAEYWLRYEIPKIPSQAALFVAAEIEKQIQRDFDAGIDPTGRPWKPLAKATLQKGRTPPPLTDTYLGRSNVRANPMQGAGVRILSTVPYMSVHQKGSRKKKIPKRPFMPEKSLPRRYLDLYAAEVARWTARVDPDK